MLGNHIVDAPVFSVIYFFCLLHSPNSFLFRPIDVRVQYGPLLLYSQTIHFLSFEGQNKFYNFSGLPEARLNRDQSVYGTGTNQRTWFIRTVSIFLFSAPDVHLRILQKMWVDGLMHKAVWETSMKKLNDDWREFILYVSRGMYSQRAYPHQQDMS